MRVIEAALCPLEKPAEDMGAGVFQGAVQDPRLAGLVEGERVLLVEPNELQAEATARMVELGGRRVWFAELIDPNAIEAIYRGATVDSPQRAEAQ